MELDRTSPIVHPRRRLRSSLVVLLAGLPFVAGPAAAHHACTDPDPLLEVDLRVATIGAGEQRFYETAVASTLEGTLTLTTTAGRTWIHFWDAACGSSTPCSANQCTYDPSQPHRVEVFCYPGPCTYTLTVVS